MYLLAQLFTGGKNKGFCILLFWHLKHPLKNDKYETICQLPSQIWVLTEALKCDGAWLGNQFSMFQRDYNFPKQWGLQQ
jgi:hypothetical protein